MGSQQVGAPMRSPVPWRPGPAMATASSPLSLCGHWPSMQAFLEATAETRAAPRPLPSSDWMKVISQLGVSLRTMAWNRSLKLRGEAGLRSLLHGLSRASSAHPPETLPAERRVGATPGNPPLHPGLSGPRPEQMETEASALASGQAPAMGSRPGHARAPGVQLVHRSVHAHGDAHHVLAAALAHAVDDARQPRAAHVRGARGHTLAGSAHDVAVSGRGPQPQRAQDIVDLLAVA